MANLIAGKYELLDEIGQRGTGITYRARDTAGDVLVAVTLLPEQLTEEQLARVDAAARRASELRHDHIVRLIDFGREGDRYHLVEAFTEAGPLDRVLAEAKGISPADVLQIARQAADALTYAHEQGVVHGNVTPASLLVERSVPLRASLCGFAAAALLTGRERPAPALLRYWAPERLASQEAPGELDARVDIFALGLVIFEMFEGKPFISATEEGEIVNQLVHGRGPLLPQFSRIVPSGVSALVARAIRRAPAERQHGMAHLRRDIDGCLGRLDRSRNDSRVTVLAESLEESPEPAPRSETSEPRPQATRKPVGAAREAVQPSRATREASASRGVVVNARGKARAQRGKIPIAAGGLVAAGLVLFGSLVLRSAHREAGTSGEVAARPGLEAPSPVGPAAVAAAASEPAAERRLADSRPIEASDVPVRTPVTPVAAPRAKQPRRKAPLRIVTFQPRQRGALSVMEGRSLVFGVRAAASEPADRLTYNWFVDGQRMSRSASWRFVAPAAATGTTHTVQVQVTDGAGPKGPRMAWHVEVFPRMEPVNVRDWLGRLAGAWERKDIATLRLYGILTNDAEAAVVRSRLSGYDHYRVAIGNEAIRTDGRYASVAFDRTELDGRGKAISSQRESFELEKYPSGFIAVRAPK